MVHGSTMVLIRTLLSEYRSQAIPNWLRSLPSRQPHLPGGTHSTSDLHKLVTCHLMHLFFPLLVLRMEHLPFGILWMFCLLNTQGFKDLLASISGKSPISHYCDSWSSKMNEVFNNQARGDSTLRQHISQLSRPENGHTRKRQRKRKVGLGLHRQFKSYHILIISLGMRHLSTQKNKMRGHHQVQMLVLQQSQHSLFFGWL